MTTERGPPSAGSPTWTASWCTRSNALPGAADFLERLVERQPPLPGADQQLDLHARATSPPGWSAPGLHVPEESIWTSALATADFLATQLPGGSAYVIGEAGLTTALYEVGYTLTDTDPDYVVLGETRTYSFEAITRAIRLIGRRRALHRHQPRRHRPVAGGAAARDRRRSRR